MADIERAKTIVLGRRLSARDALHVATMERHGVSRIMTFDRGYDAHPGIARLSGDDYTKRCHSDWRSTTTESHARLGQGGERIAAPVCPVAVFRTDARICPRALMR